MNASPLRRMVAASAAAVAVFATAPAHAATIPSGPASSADAYGLYVNVKLLPTHTQVPVVGPLARSSQEYPPGAAQPATANVLQAGPVPADASVVNHVGVITSLAGANGAPNAVAYGEVSDVSLLGPTGQSKVTADVVRGQANADCVNNPNGTGTTFVNLKINGSPVDQTPAPNTVIDLQVAKVILNEQHPAFDGRGIVVNAIHVISTTTGDPLFRGDVIVGHAMATVNCTNGAPSTGGSNPIKMMKDAVPTTATPGTEVTYTATVTNTGSAECLVTALIEHLSSAFDFVSTAGDFGTSAVSSNRPGGGVDLTLGNGTSIGAGATKTQVFTAKVKDGQAPGVYYNNLEVLCANLGDYVKGLDAPVRVTDETEPSPTPTKLPQCSDGKDNDGDGKIDFGKDPGCTSPQDDDERDNTGTHPRTGANEDLLLLGGLGLVGAAVVTRRVRLALR